MAESQSSEDAIRLLNKQLDQISQISPFASNLFEVDFFGQGHVNEQDAESFQMKVAPIFATAIKFDGMKFEFHDQHGLTKESNIKKVTNISEVTLTWKEDSRLAMFNYHRSWGARFYNRKTDSFVSGTVGKKRTASVSILNMRDTLQFNNYEADNETGVGSRTPHKLRLIGLIPKDIPGLNLDYNSSAASSFDGHSMTYKVDAIEFVTSEESSADASADGIKVDMSSAGYVVEGGSKRL